MTRMLLATLVFGVLAPLSSLQAESPAVLLEKGIYAEQTKGDVDAAMAIYKTILADAKANRPFLAQAQYRLGMCLLKKKKPTEATAVFQELITKYPEQKALVAKAHAQIANSRKKITGAELQAIVRKAVMTISTCAETDPRVKKSLATLEGLNEAETVKAIAQYLPSEKNTVRRSAIYILWQGPFVSIAPAEAGLIKACSNPEGLTRGMAALALGGRKVKAAFKPLCDMTLNDKSPFARRCGAYGLGLLGDQKAVPILQKATKDKEEFVANNAESALTMLKMGAAGDAQLPPEVMAYIVKKQMQTYVLAKRKGVHANAHIYGVDDRFNKYFGGLLVVRNNTTSPITHEIGIGNFSYKGFDVYDQSGTKQKIRFVDRNVRKGGRYRLMWTPRTSIMPEQIVLLGWKRNATSPLPQVKGGHQLRMNNYLGAAGIENFFMVVPAGMKIVSASKMPSQVRQISGFDIHLWQREVTAKTNNTVDVVLGREKTMGLPVRPEDLKQAKIAVERWFSLLDKGKYAETWSELAPFAQKAVTKKKWVTSLNWVYRGLGKATSREQLSATYYNSLPGAPEGEYVILTFKTTFKNKEDTTEATETITPMKCKDGKWRVSGYYVK